jgi:hypothetical protein
MLPSATGVTADHVRNKERLCNLAIACIAYINCENITLERQTVPEKVNRKLARKGKQVLEEYYLCHLRTSRGETGEGSGSGHGYCYGLRGHFRRLPDGKLMWVRAHQRG